MTDYPLLFSPLRIGNLTLKNRIAVAPMGTEPNTSGYLSEQNLAAYELRARGGAAIVTRGETLIGHKTDSAHGNLCNLGEERYLPSHLQLTDVIHQHNALANIEILHCGARAHPRYTGGVIWGPSPGPGVYGVEVTEMNEEMIEEVANCFAEAAFMAKFGGFDLIMIHGAHGWLLSQFLSPLFNRRRDRFGGSLENRARFPLLVIERIRAKVGLDFPIEYRMSGDEFMVNGYGLGEAVDFARLIEDKVDLIHVSAGTFLDVNSGCRMFPSAFLPHGVNVYLAAAIKRAVQTPVATVGALSDPHQMEAILAEGAADLIVMGRQILADPHFPNKVRTGRGDEVRPCIRCNHCLSLDFVPYVPLPSGISQCSVNPVIGRELRESYYRPAPESRKVLVAGGGVGGLQAALSAAAQGHEVILCERKGFLGGPLQSFTEGVYFKADLRRFLAYLVRMVEQEPRIAVRLGVEVSPKLVAEIKPDTLICALGSRPTRLELPGFDLPHVLSVTEVAPLERIHGEKIVIIGGGLAGCETGLALAQGGKQVTILERDKVLAKDTPVLHFKALMLEFAKVSTALQALNNCLCTAITKEGVHYQDQQGEKRFLPADQVILSCGTQPSYGEIEQLRSTSVDQFVVIGDNLRVGKVLQAVHGGYFAGKNA